MLGSVVRRYFKVLRNRWLTKPEGGRDYEFVHPEEELVLPGSWEHQLPSWDLKNTFQRDGHLELLTAIRITSWKTTTYPVDRILGIYALLKDEDKVSLSELDTAAARPSSESEAERELRELKELRQLEQLWERTMVKTVTSGRVWPLLYDAIRADAPTWMPRIVGGATCEVYPEILGHRNRGGVEVAKDGLHITARVVGRLTGASAPIGHGGGEVNVMIGCTWVLVAKGFDPQPILELLTDGLDKSDMVPPQELEHTQKQLDDALHAPSLADCFGIVEKQDLRSKLRFAPGISGWNMAVFLAQDARKMEASGSYVFLGWIHASQAPNPDDCWILDVTFTRSERCVLLRSPFSRKIKILSTGVSCWISLVEIFGGLAMTLWLVQNIKKFTDDGNALRGILRKRLMEA